MLSNIYVVTIIITLVAQLLNSNAAAAVPSSQPRADRAQIAGIKVIIDDSFSPVTGRYVIIINEYSGKQLERQTVANPIATLPNSGDRFYLTQDFKALPTVEGDITIFSFSQFETSFDEPYEAVMMLTLTPKSSLTDLALGLYMGIDFDKWTPGPLFAEVDVSSGWECRRRRAKPDQKICLWTPRNQNEGNIEHYQWYPGHTIPFKWPGETNNSEDIEK